MTYLFVSHLFYFNNFIKKINMLILGKFKDYYDYLCGIYGIDKDIVYDRTNAYVLGKSDNLNDSIYFSREKLSFDKPKKNARAWIVNDKGKSVFKNVLIGTIYHFVIEVGNTQYLFEVERYLDDINDDKVHIDVKFLMSFDISEKKSKEPLSLIPCIYYRYRFGSDVKKISSYDIKNEIKNPILKDTYITSYIDPTEIYDKIYNYLISIREKPIIDKRNDVQKLEGYGFDKKTSFRHPIK